jgi:hypothetical protein
VKFLVNGYFVDVVSPSDQAVLTTTLPTVTVHVESELGTPVDLQVEWRTAEPYQLPFSTVWYPDPTYTQSFDNLTSGDPFQFQPPVALDYRTWYLRVRAGDSSTDTWTPWTRREQSLNLQPVLGSVTQAIDVNIGVTVDSYAGAIAYSDMNIGVQVEEFRDVIEYTDLNVGVDPTWLRAVAYSDLNVYPPTGQYVDLAYLDLNVLSARPDPLIWWIRPEMGREGYVFRIIGHGFGSFQNEWDGAVFLGALACPVMSWDRVAADASPDEISKGATNETDVIKPEHGVIVVAVPFEAVSGNVKVVLSGGVL